MLLPPQYVGQARYEISSLLEGNHENVILMSDLSYKQINVYNFREIKIIHI